MSILTGPELAEVERRTAEVRAGFEQQLADLTAQHDRTLKQIEQHLVSRALADAALAAGVHPGAVPDVLNRGTRMFRLVDGEAVAMDGDVPLTGKDGQPLTASAWAAGLAETAPHLFPAEALRLRLVAGQAEARRHFVANADAIGAGKVKPMRIIPNTNTAPQPADADVLAMADALGKPN